MIKPGELYVVPTPIGNLGDMSPRAVSVLQAVDLILAEDTRHSAPLLRHFQITTPCKSFHEHNEKQLANSVCEQILDGQSMALISDAGTPLISDPGFPLVRLAHEQGIKVISIPGPCAAIAAVAASGLAVDRFSFEGFLPHKSEARKKVLGELVREPRTLIFYESPHRIQATVDDMTTVFGAERKVVLAREISKLFETILHTDLGSLAEIVSNDADQRKGEIVLVVEGVADSGETASDIETETLMRELLTELPLKKAVGLAVKITGGKKNALYQLALKLQEQNTE